MTRPLTCRELTHFLDPYLEDAVPESERARFDTHLSCCPACVSYLRGYREAIALGRRAHAVSSLVHEGPMPEALVRAILAAQASRH